jgi:hypothetical protein
VKLGPLGEHPSQRLELGEVLVRKAINLTLNKQSLPAPNRADEMEDVALFLAQAAMFTISQGPRMTKIEVEMASGNPECGIQQRIQIETCGQKLIL